MLLLLLRTVCTYDWKDCRSFLEEELLGGVAAIRVVEEDVTICNFVCALRTGSGR